MAVITAQLVVVVTALPVKPATVGIGSQRDGKEHDCEQPFHELRDSFLHRQKGIVIFRVSPPTPQQVSVQF